MSSVFILVPKAEFDVLDGQTKVQAVNASTSYALSQVAVITIANISYYCFELEDENLAWFTILINYRMITEAILKQAIESGVYDPLG